MSFWGVGGDFDNDAVSGSGTYPRYALAFAEAGTADDTVAAEDVVWGFLGPTTVSGTDGKFVLGIVNGALPTTASDIDIADFSGGIVAKTDRVTAKPGIVLDPTTTTLAPDTLGSLMYDSGSDELKYYDGSWQIISAGGLSSHALDGVYHTATGLTAGDILSADSATTFSWKANPGGTDGDAIHDNVANEITAITPKTALAAADEFVLEDSAASFVKKAVTFANIESSISLANLGVRTHASLSDAPADAHHVAFISTDADALISTHAGDDNAHHEVFESGDFTTAFAAEDFNNLATTAHVLASSDHTVSGLTAGDILSADTSTTYSWKANPAATVPLALTDLASYTQGSIIIGGGVDWEALGAGTLNYVLKMGASEPAWGQVDYGELTGVPSTFDPVAHDLTSAYHTDSGLTAGWFLKADSTTAFSWQAHGLGASDVGAYTTAQTDSAIDTDITTHAGVDNAHHAVFESSDFTTAFAAESLANLATRTHAGLSDAPADAHHPKVHALIDATNHPESGLTTGHFLKATGTTSYAFGAHGLTASDVGAAAALSGTQYQIPMFDTTTTIGNSVIKQDSGGTLVTIDSTTDKMELVVSSSDDYAGIYAFSTATVANHPMMMIGKNATEDYAYFMAVRNTSTAVFDSLVIETNTTGSGADGRIEFKPNETLALTLNPDGTTTLAVISAESTDVDTFLVSNSGLIKSRTGAQVLSDIGAATAPLALTDLASYVQGSIIIGGGADWEPLVAGTPNYILKMGADEPAWGQVDYSELSGTQPSPIDHVHSVGDGGQLDWDTIWSDAVHSHASDAEGSTLTWANALAVASAGDHDHSDNTKGNAVPEASITFSATGHDHDGTGSENVDYTDLDSIPSTFTPAAHILATTGPHSSALPLIDIASYVQGSLIIGGGTDWEPLVAGTPNYVLKMGASEPAWGQVDWSELSGSQPAPISHDFDVHSGSVDLTDLSPTGAGQGGFIKYGTTDWEILGRAVEGKFLRTGIADIAWGDVDYSDLVGTQPAPIAHVLDSATHTITGKTGGHFLKADSATTYSFQAHGLTASDVGAAAALSGTQWTLPVFDTTTTIGDSMLSQDSGGSLLTVDGDFTVAGGTLLVDSDAEEPSITVHTDLASTNARLILDSMDDSILEFKVVGATKGLIYYNTGQTALFINSVSEIRLIPSGESDNYIELTVDTNVPKIDAVGGNNIQIDGVDVGAEPARISTEIDTDISTHAGDDNAHHEVIETADVDALILTHKNISAAHHTKYTTVESEAVITAELVDGQSIDNAIDALVLTHKNLAAAHHSRYTDGEVEDVITVELVNGQSIDNRIDTLISNHAGVSVAHQNAPLLIAAAIAAMPSYPRWSNIALVNGATSTITYSGISVLGLPASDDNASFACTIKIPDDWSGTTGNLKINYSVGTVSNAYSGEWTVGSFSAEEVITTPNVLNQSTAYDFAAQSNTDRFYEKTIPLTSLAAGDLMGIRFASDASNSTAVYVMDVWLEP